MFRPSSLGHHHGMRLYRGNYTIYDTMCEIKSLLFNEVCYVVCAHQPAGFVLLVQACVLQSRDAYWLPHSILLFPLHFSSRASPCTITFQLYSTTLA